MLLDTDVLIDYLRGQADAVLYLEAISDPLFISSITVAELYVGVRDGSDRMRLELFLQAMRTLPLDSDIAIAGGLYRRNYGKSHGVGLADALIAATAAHYNLPLVTLNQKHFPMVQNLIVPYRKAI